MAATMRAATIETTTLRRVRRTTSRRRPVGTPVRFACVAGGGRLTSIDGGAGTGRRRVVSRSRGDSVPPCGGALLVVGRAGDAVELHWAAVFSRAPVRLPRPRRFDSWTADSTSRRRRGTTTRPLLIERVPPGGRTRNARGASRAGRAGRQCALLAVGDAAEPSPGGSPRGTLPFRLRVQGEVGRVRRGGGVAPVVGTEDEPAPTRRGRRRGPGSASNSRAMGSSGAPRRSFSRAPAAGRVSRRAHRHPVGRVSAQNTVGGGHRAAHRGRPRREASKTTVKTPFGRGCRSFSSGVAPPPPSHPDDAVRARRRPILGEPSHPPRQRRGVAAKAHPSKVSYRTPGGDGAVVPGEDGVVANRPTAFAATSSRGRVLTWALPSLAPLAEVGPLPLSAAASGFRRWVRQRAWEAGGLETCRDPHAEPGYAESRASSTTTNSRRRRRQAAAAAMAAMAATARGDLEQRRRLPLRLPRPRRRRRDIRRGRSRPGLGRVGKTRCERREGSSRVSDR